MKKGTENPTKVPINPQQSHIFIIGDTSNVGVNLQNLLEQEGYEVSTAPKGSEVLRQMLDAAPEATVLALQVAVQHLDRMHDATENSQEHAGTLFPPEMPLKREILEGDYADIIGESAELVKVLYMIERFAKFPTTVLISGETGTGKELVADALHKQSNRSKKKFLTVNCAGLSEQLVDTELFGYEKGAFTGAEARRIGLFEAARGGTLFLDEIGEFSEHLQSKLLRVLQAGKIRRVGGTAEISVDVRVVAATNCDLAQAVKEDRFRADLYQRLKPLHILMPPLRQRREDIPALVEHFLKKHNRIQGQKRGSISPQALALLQGYDWPGNIRELEGSIIYALHFARDSAILPMHLPQFLQEDSTHPVPLPEEHSDGEEVPTVSFPIGRTLKEIEQVYILETLEWMDGHRAKTASVLGINVQTLRSRLKNYNVS
ncbi:MAG: sigma-54 dependent transcriptional regulator [Candidatus Poribacteria bacterium]|nr:sigma-54 dependent transcriptional regulator [Candidatus Poribacteria bacterium]